MPFDIPELVGRLSRGRVLVAGDVILDRHVRGTVERVSPEAPIQVLGVEHEEDSPGGAANVACKVAELGGRAVLAGVVGGDEEGRRLLEATKAFGVDCSACVEDGARPTTLKTRYTARDQQLLRVDRESRAPVSGEVARRLAEAVGRELPSCEAVVVEDYGKGTLPPEVLKPALARAGGIPVVVDPCGTDWSRYRGAAVVTPNERELELAAWWGQRRGPDCAARAESLGPGDLVRLARAVIDEAGVGAVAVTRGREGILVVTPDSDETVSTSPVEVYDVTGAGDAVAAAFALALAGGLTLTEAAAVANAAGRLVVQQVGVGHVSRDRLVHPKLGSRDQAAAEAGRVKATGGKVVFTNGCFDLLHPGHVKLLEEARAHGDFLVVGINADDSIRRIKGPGRPILSQQERLQVMCGLSSVDLVTFFGEDPADEDKPLRLIEAISPDVLVKGGGYEESEIVGAKHVRGYGGEVVRVPLVEGVSTSSIVGRMKETDQERPARNGPALRGFSGGAERPSRREWRDE